VTGPVLSLDCLGMACPRPIIELARRIADVGVGEEVEILADDPAAQPDLVAWCRMRGHDLVGAEPPRFVVRRAQ
jgi:tRNA 2-thiouridine synthesizing protein A